MAIAFDDEYNLKIPGLTGVRLGPKKNSNGALDSMYPTMSQQKFSLPANLAKNVEKFIYNPDGSLMAWVPDAQGRSVTGASNYEQMLSQNGGRGVNGSYGAGDFARPITPIGEWLAVEGLKLDKSTLSGEAKGDVYIEDENGPIATFKQGGQINGYMRFATQQPQSSDKLRLGNSSGTTSGSIRQNAQRRTLL